MRDDALETGNSSLAVILGTAFSDDLPAGISLRPETIQTPAGPWTLHKVSGLAQPAHLSFRHGIPHRRLPNQISYTAQAHALRAVNCGALLVTSSVGVLDPSLPLYRPLAVSDLLMLDNRLPNGAPCTVFTEPSPDHGHLVLHDGLFSRQLTNQIAQLAEGEGAPLAGEAVFAYAGGPRTKTRAENRLLGKLGAQVNSMTLGPEVVLANELEIPCAGLVVGHKYSVPDREAPSDDAAMAETLVESRRGMERILLAFLRRGRPVAFRNQIYRFGKFDP